MKDLRDPIALGNAYLELRAGGVSADIASRVPVADHSANPTPVEKYGDPVMEHRARIAAGLEVELP